jgi:hypothetical protein
MLLHESNVIRRGTEDANECVDKVDVIRVLVQQIELLLSLAIKIVSRRCRTVCICQKGLTGQYNQSVPKKHSAFKSVWISQVDHCQQDFENRTFDISKYIAYGWSPLTISNCLFKRRNILVAPLSLAEFFNNLDNKVILVFCVISTSIFQPSAPFEPRWDGGRFQNHKNLVKEG